MALVLYAIAGNSAEWEFPITEADGSPKVLTGATNLSFLVKGRVDDLDAAAVVTSTPTVTDAEGGLVEVRLTPADTSSLAPGDYVWGIQFKDSAGKLWEFPGPSLDPGRFRLRASVVQATP